MVCAHLKENLRSLKGGCAGSVICSSIPMHALPPFNMMAGQMAWHVRRIS